MVQQSLILAFWVLVFQRIDFVILMLISDNWMGFWHMTPGMLMTAGVAWVSSAVVYNFARSHRVLLTGLTASGAVGLFLFLRSWLPHGFHGPWQLTVFGSYFAIGCLSAWLTIEVTRRLPKKVERNPLW